MLESAQNPFKPQESDKYTDSKNNNQSLGFLFSVYVNQVARGRA